MQIMQQLFSGFGFLSVGQSRKYAGISLNILLAAISLALTPSVDCANP